MTLLIISCSLCDNITGNEKDNNTVDEEVATIKILFIGSSYFDYNNLPELFRELATAGGKDPADWKLRIFTERSNPWEEWLNIDADTDTSPVVNVWFDTSTFDQSENCRGSLPNRF